jgi:hypothetical protein
MRRAIRLAVVLAALAAPTARGAEVWTGGSRAWGDLTTAGNEKQWTFLQQNVDGLYTNNFSMRAGESTVPTRAQRLAGMVRLLKNKRVFYETDRIHSTDAFDRDSLAAFDRAGFEYAGVTINYGTDDGRDRIITRDGRVPLYYMFGPWTGDGDIGKPKNDKLRAEIRRHAGAAVDDPVTMWRGPDGHNGTRPMVYSTVKWCHANGQKFLFLLAPNESGPAFLPEAEQLVRDLEDHDANPDVWAVAFYGPQSFRDRLPVLPEADAKGEPAATFTGVPYWLLHHLRDPKRWARLSLPDGAVPSIAPGQSRDVPVDLTNASDWLDLTPVVRLRPAAVAGYHVRATLDGVDVTPALLGEGIVFNRSLRLAPRTSRRMILTVTGDTAADPPATLTLELVPHPSEPSRVNQALRVRIGGDSRSSPGSANAASGPRSRLG